ncbi:uncharacterized protein VTP21DRAFT_1691 [Calcarisporiella thermophila]|uniref:uncharacterized protein n=1 Tax=Calcarisporiella thermophila TaxID=911321 RepID=UPI00374404CF
MTTPRIFFRVWDGINRISDAHSVISYFEKFGPLIEYKFTRCPETKRYLGYGFLSYKSAKDAGKLLEDKFHHIAELNKEVKVERAGKSTEEVISNRRLRMKNRLHETNPSEYATTFSGFYPRENSVSTGEPGASEK